VCHCVTPSVLLCHYGADVLLLAAILVLSLWFHCVTVSLCAPVRSCLCCTGCLLVEELVQTYDEEALRAISVSSTTEAPGRLCCQDPGQPPVWWKLRRQLFVVGTVADKFIGAEMAGVPVFELPGLPGHACSATTSAGRALGIPRRSPQVCPRYALMHSHPYAPGNPRGLPPGFSSGEACHPGGGDTDGQVHWGGDGGGPWCLTPRPSWTCC